MKIFAMALAFLLCLLALGDAGADSEKKPVDLKVGDPAPVFSGVDDQSRPWKSSDHVGKKTLVVYFYPADQTPGCTRQACAFRDDQKRLACKGVEVVGVSGDSARNHDIFKKVHQLNFTLLADENGAIARKFGVPFGAGGNVTTQDSSGNTVVLKRGGTAQRWTFVIGKDGKILYKNTQVNPAQDSKQVLELISKQEK